MMDKKDVYEKPELEIQEFLTEDVLTASSVDDDPNEGEWDPMGV